MVFIPWILVQTAFWRIEIVFITHKTIKNGTDKLKKSRRIPTQQNTGGGRMKVTAFSCASTLARCLRLLRFKFGPILVHSRPPPNDVRYRVFAAKLLARLVFGNFCTGPPVLSVFALDRDMHELAKVAVVAACGVIATRDRLGNMGPSLRNHGDDNNDDDLEVQLCQCCFDGIVWADESPRKSPGKSSESSVEERRR